MNRKKIVVVGISVAFFIAIFSIVIAASDVSKKQSGHVVYKDDWALCNYGQTIDGQKGVAGIDIGVVDVKDNIDKNPSVIVAVVDSGVDPDCSLLQNRLLTGWDFYNSDSSIYDDYLYDYHGTYVSTTITRVAPCVTVLPVKFMESTYGSISDAVSSVEYAINHGAKIINCSWETSEENVELRNLIRNNPDILFICAAGNYSGDLDKTKLFPCSYEYDNIISVIAVDNCGLIHETSGYGAISADVAAPGKDVKVTISEDDVVYIDGTSVATAFVSAEAAILLSKYPNMSSSTIREIILSSVTPICEIANKCQSGGIINIANALHLSAEY